MSGSRIGRLFAGVVLAAVVGVGAVAAVSAADGGLKTRTAGDKLGRGLSNIFFSIIEVPRNIHLTTEEQSLLAGWTVGFGKGLGYMVMRMGVGVYEVVTFPFPLPKDYEPVIQPEYVWEEPGPRLK
jgi:putative exosortase-associated protein (TIGR04073 family)